MAAKKQPPGKGAVKKKTATPKTDAAPKKGAGGRPSKYKPEMCDRVIELMTEGASQVEVCADIGISRETYNQWCKPGSNTYIKEFADANDKGVALSQAWWEKLGRLGAAGMSEINPVVWIFNMKNRFKWHDKQALEVSGDQDKPIKQEVTHTLTDWDVIDKKMDQFGGQ